MPDTLMYDEDAYVFLDTGQPEALLTPAELQTRLRTLLVDAADELPPDLQALPTVDAQVEELLATHCDLTIGADRYVQWYAVRLEK